MAAKRLDEVLLELGDVSKLPAAARNALCLAYGLQENELAERAAKARAAAAAAKVGDRLVAAATKAVERLKVDADQLDLVVTLKVRVESGRPHVYDASSRPARASGGTSGNGGGKGKDGRVKAVQEALRGAKPPAKTWAETYRKLAQAEPPARESARKALASWLVKNDAAARSRARELGEEYVNLVDAVLPDAQPDAQADA